MEQLRAYHAERMEVETQEDREIRLNHASGLQQLRLPMETEERQSRLEQMSALQQQRLSAETDEMKRCRLEQVSALQQHGLSTESEKRAKRLSAAAREGNLKFNGMGIFPCLSNITSKPECLAFTRKWLPLRLLHAQRARRAFLG